MPSPLGNFSYTWPFLAAAVAGYLLGSIPFGLLLTRLAGMGDIRKIGSGNIGATNVLRTGNRALAALTLLLDGGKGAAAVLLGARFGPDTAFLAGCRRHRRPPLSALAPLQGRQGRRHGLGRAPCRSLSRRLGGLRHLARRGIPLPLLLARSACELRPLPALRLAPWRPSNRPARRLRGRPRLPPPPRQHPPPPQRRGAQDRRQEISAVPRLGQGRIWA